MPEWRWAWRRASCRALPAELRIFAFKLLHATLWTNAYHSHVRASMALADSRPFCAHPGCDGELEGLLHLFMHCPRAAPVIDWLLDVWQAVAGERPPRCAAVLLADCHTVWRPPCKHLQQLWTVLRLSTLHALWKTRAVAAVANPPLPLPPPAAVVAAAVRGVRRLIQLDYTRVVVDARGLTNASSAWFAGRDPRLGLDEFLRRWGRGGVLCSVEGPQLQLHFTAAHPAGLAQEAPAG